MPTALIGTIISFLQVGVRLGNVCTQFRQANNINCRNRIKLLFGDEVGTAISQQLENLLYNYCGKRITQLYLKKSRSMLLKLRTNSKQENNVCERLKNGKLSTAQFVQGVVGNKPLVFASEKQLIEHKKWCEKQMAKATIKEPAPNGQGLFKCERCKSQRIHYRLWKRKRQVDRYRIVLRCHDCGHAWDN